MARHALTSWGRGGDQRGASLVEFAIIMPLIFALLLGMFTGGLSLSRRNSMQNAVREATRLGATLQDGVNWAAGVQNRAVSLSSGDLSASQVCVELFQKTASGESTLRETSCSFPADEPASTDVPVGQCAVKVWAQRTSDLQVVFFSQTLTLRTGAINRYERADTSGTCAP